MSKSKAPSEPVPDNAEGTEELPPEPEPEPEPDKVTEMLINLGLFCAIIIVIKLTPFMLGMDDDSSCVPPT